MTTEREKTAQDRGNPPQTVDPGLPKKTDSSLVILDSPDDGEICETGDASDFAGAKRDEPKRSNGKANTSPRPS